MRNRLIILTILALGVVGMYEPGALFDYHPFPPNWITILAYGMVAISAYLVRTPPEGRGVLWLAIGVVVVSNWVFWDAALFEWLMPPDYTLNYDWVLRYILPLAIFAPAVSSLVIMLARVLRRLTTRRENIAR